MHYDKVREQVVARARLGLGQARATADVKRTESIQRVQLRLRVTIPMRVT
jgi:hypothetical protein